MPATYEDTILPGDQFSIRRRYINGETATLTGDRALALADTPEAAKWRQENPAKFLKNYYSPMDARDSNSYAFGQFLKNNGEPNGVFGSIADGGILPGAAAGGVVGAGAGALLGALKKFLTGNGKVSNWALTGAALGGLLGGHNGYVRTRHISPEAAAANATTVEGLMRQAEKNKLQRENREDVDYDNLFKSAATYQDPRNFILEKLQAATDATSIDKVKLAARVKNLSRADAERLAALVRSALGFGVGAIISKFVFGASGAGPLFGGLAGVLGANLLVNSMLQKNTAPSFDFNFRPLSYRDIL